MTTYVPALTQIKVSTGQVNQFGYPESCLHGQQEKSTVASTDPGGTVRSREQSASLLSSKKGNQWAVEPLAGHGEDSLDESGVLGMPERRELVEGVQRRQSGVPCPHAVAAVLLQMLEELAHQLGAEIVEIELRWRLARLLVSKFQKESEAVAVGCYRV